MLGVWTFRIATSAMPVLTALEIQLQQHVLDPWALGASAVGSAIVMILHFGRSGADQPAAIADFTPGTDPATLWKNPAADATASGVPLGTLEPPK